jgi:hypothetical protein
LPYAANPPKNQPSIGPAHAPKYTPPHSAQASNQPEGPVNFSAGLLDLTGSHPRRTGPTFRRQAVGFRPSSAGHDALRGDVAAGGAEAAEALRGEAASASSPMRLYAKMFGVSPVEARRPLQSNSVFIQS